MTDLSFPTSLGTSDADQIRLLGQDLTADLMGQVGFGELAFWLVAMRLAQPDAAARDALLQAANDAGYHCRPVWTLLNKLPMYLDCPRAPLPVAEAIEASLINLPSSPRLAGAAA